MKKIIKQFEQPSAEFRGKPFWAWNGKLEEDELRRQIQIMKTMGLGGFFMHSRVGLSTPYLGKEWFELTKACIDEGIQQNMESWLYDEDRWPSGAAGGLVTKDPKYRQRRLQMEVLDTPPPPSKQKAVLAMFAAVIEGAQAKEVERLAAGKKPPKHKQVLVFRVVEAPLDSWYNGYTYLDTLSHDAVNKFIEVTHDAYKREVGDQFAKNVKGMFTDEPNHGGTIICEKDQSLYTAVWTDQLLKVFKSRYGYDLKNHLVEIFFDVDGKTTTPARLHYHDCKTFLFVDAFARQIGEWCEQNRLLHTGHVLDEPVPSVQTHVVGSAMRFYEHMQAPGVDILTEYWDEYNTIKQCASVVHQTGRKWLLSELYGCTGWDFGLDGHKRVGDWQAVLGVNLRCPHLSWYTMQGEAKRDYPASILHHSPYWQHYSLVEDYFARLGVVLTRGEPIRPLLVIHPIESTWARFRIGWRESADIQQLDHQIKQLTELLLGNQFDFDFGDEEMLSRMAKVVQTKTGPALKVGKAVYQTVLVPPMVTIRGTTLDLLEKFRAQNGQVVFLDQPAPLQDGVPNARPAEVANTCQRLDRMRPSDIAKALESVRLVSVQTNTGKPCNDVFYMLRREQKTHYLFVVNRSKDQSTPPLEITLPFGTAVEEWDATTGQRWLADYKKHQHGVKITTQLPVCGSRLFVVSPTASSLKRAPASDIVSQTKVNQRAWQYQLDEPNVLVLDRAELQVKQGSWNSAQEILRVDRAVRDAAKLPHRGGSMVQPWARQPSDVKPIPIALRYQFQVQQRPATSLKLALETPERVQSLTLNGSPLDLCTVDGWWVDKSIQTLPVDPSLLRLGTNEIILTMEYGENDGLETMFLLGLFGVQRNATELTISDLPDTLKLGDICQQGLPFYSGSITYNFALEATPANKERVVLQLDQFAGACVRLLIDGTPVNVLGWQPYEFDLTDYLCAGKTHDIGIQVIGNRRNSFGPLHMSNPDPMWTGPAEFVRMDGTWIEEHHCKPIGLLKPPVVMRQKLLNS